MPELHGIDYAVIGTYLLIAMGFGVLFRKQQTRSDFFLAGRSMGRLTVGLSVMATLFSANSFVMYPSSAYGSSLRLGLSLIAFLAMAPLVVWVFIPVYSRLNCQTAYEYLERRFHVSVRCLASGLFILLRVGWMASATFAASVAVSGISGLNQYGVILALGTVAIVYTMLGGLRAVMWTDVLQFFVFAITIGLALMLLVTQSDGGLVGMTETYFRQRENLIVDFTPSMTLKYGSWAILIGIFLEALSAFGADQVAVQRYIAARCERTSQIGFGINLLGMWIVIPGLLAIGVGLYSYFQHRPHQLAPMLVEQISQHPEPTSYLKANNTRIAESLAEANGTNSPSLSPGRIAAYYRSHPEAVRHDVRALTLQDRAFPRFVRLRFPPGVLGLLVAALMSAMMSSIDSGIHSVTTALLVDFRDRLVPAWRPATAGGEMILDRALILLFGVTAVTLACFVEPLGDVFDVGKKVTAAFGGPLLAVFILALFVPRITTLPTVLAIFAGAGLTLWLMYQHPDWFSVWFWPIGFATTLVVAVVGSLLLPPVGQRDSAPSLTYWSVIGGRTE